MNKKCARCEKTVYPIEELKCLDKIWHKQCFKCQVCNMTLNMRNYKGFNKDPYCEAHIPKAKATTVAETPELKRIAENTKLQSNVKYHAEFEKTKGKLTQVADDPETLRIKQNSKIISNVAYHGDLQKKAAMEQKRHITGGDTHSDIITSADAENMNYRQPDYVAPPAVVAPQQQQQQSYQHHQSKHQQPPQSRDYGNVQNNSTYNSPYTARQTSSTVIYTSERGPVNSSTSARHIGSIADLDPVNNYYGSLSSATTTTTTHQNNSNTGNHNISQQQQQHQQRASGRIYRAMYDYDAQDADEVSFIDGDLIVDCTSVDAGWMTGLVQRTGEVGMLPANYVEPAL